MPRATVKVEIVARKCRYRYSSPLRNTMAVRFPHASPCQRRCRAASCQPWSRTPMLRLRRLLDRRWDPSMVRLHSCRRLISESTVIQ
eukprot:6161510-Pyramimonas_sp.AAC.1